MAPHIKLKLVEVDEIDSNFLVTEDGVTRAFTEREFRKQNTIEISGNDLSDTFLDAHDIIENLVNNL